MAGLGLTGDEMGADGHQHVCGAPFKRVLGEELIELVLGAGLDRFGEQIGFAGEPAVDRAGGEASPASDLGYACALIALLGEDLGRRHHESCCGGVERFVDRGQRHGLR